jgi:hypothetical protein
MSRRGRDVIDVAIEEWARQRRRIVGVEAPLTAREFIGPVRCTLGNRRGLHGKGNGRWDQPYPELYTGRMVRAVNAAYWASNPRRKLILDVHYVMPGQADAKAQAIGISRPTYYRRVQAARSFIENFLNG